MPAETELRLAIRIANPQALQQLGALHKQLGVTGADAFDRVRKSAGEAGEEIQRVGHFGKFSFQVLQAFLLYKGFVFLKMQAQEFTRELVEMEHQVALTQTQLNSLGRDFRPVISSRVLDIASHTGIALEELAATEYEVISANIELTQSFKVLELTARASVAGGLKDSSLAFDAALTQINAFELGVESLNSVLDKQFNLIKRGIFSYEQYARVSGEISIAFSQIDQDVNVANAALAAISQIYTGPQLAEGATRLKNAALALNENVEAFEAYGIQVHDAEGNFRNFIDILADLKRMLDSLSPAEQRAILLDLFDEKRARAGVEALLKQFDSLNQFYVEQQFALGDMNDAYETMNDTLKDQAQIFKNELIPAFEPFVELLRDTLELLRAAGGLVGGTENLAILAMGIAGGATLGLANRYGLQQGRGFATTSQNHAIMVPNFALPNTLNGPDTRYRIPLPSRATLALGGLGGFLAYQQGQQQGGIGLGDVVSTVGGAALGGAAFGGPVGAVTFGSLAAAGLFLGEVLQEQAPEVGKSFAEAFTESLVEESKGVAEAFSDAMKSSAKDNGFGRFFDPRVLQGGTVVQNRDLNEWERIRSRAPTWFGVPFIGNLPTTQEVSFPGLQQLIQNKRLSDIIAMGSEAQRLAEGLGDIPGAPDPKDARLIAIKAGIDQIIPDNLAKESEGVARALETILNAMVEYNLTLEQQERAFAILKSGTGITASEADRGITLESKMQEALLTFSTFLREANAPEPAPVDPLLMLEKQIEGLVTGSLDPLILVFEDLGEAGKEAADAFRVANETLHRFKAMQELLEIQFETNVRYVTASVMDRDGNITEGSDVTKIEKKDLLDIINENFKDAPITREELATAFYEELRTQITSAFLEGFPDMSREDAINFLLNGGTAEPPLVVPGMTDLADAAFEAADLLRDGLFTSTEFTAAELEAFGDSLKTFNQQIFKVGIVQELQRLGEIAGVDTSNLKNVIEELVKNIEIAGHSFQEVLSDPTKLADLLAELKFGDIQVDNSTQNNFVVRIEAAMDTEAIANTADQLIIEINKRLREQD